MRRAGLLLIFILICSFLPCQASNFEFQDSINGGKIFIYHIPDEEVVKPIKEQIKSETQIEQEHQDIISDDVTADTSGNIEEEIVYNDDEDDEVKTISLDEEGYEISDMYSDILKGYAVYNEDEENTVFLDDNLDELLTIKIQQPYNFKGGKYLASKSLSPLMYSKLNSMEYSITPISNVNYKTKNGFTAGAMFDQCIDYAELEQSTGVFSRYDTKYFGIYTAFQRTLNSTNSNYNDNVYFSPEFKLNQYFTLKQILSADITRNRKKAELVISINPFGKKDTDRMRIEFGANATYDDSNSLLKNQIKFSTSFKL
ncbi:hypothetical protein IJ541_10070 [bacterium]|nr:hypothetical protein [bacterium]